MQKAELLLLSLLQSLLVSPWTARLESQHYHAGRAAVGVLATLHTTWQLLVVWSCAMLVGAHYAAVVIVFASDFALSFAARRRYCCIYQQVCRLVLLANLPTIVSCYI
jgi:hypothetical protein